MFRVILVKLIAESNRQKPYYKLGDLIGKQGVEQTYEKP